MAGNANGKKSFSNEEFNQLVMNSIIQSQGNKKNNLIESALIAQKMAS
jgi:hypothetical protein